MAETTEMNQKVQGNENELFNDHQEEENDKLNSSKESEPESVDLIKEYIENQQNSKNETNLEPEGESIKVLDDIHKSQENPIAKSVMNMILNDSGIGVSKSDTPASVMNPGNKMDKGTVALSVGSKVEAKYFDGEWHAATIIEVDYDEVEVLVHYEDSNNMHDEWISVNSSRLRPYNPNRIVKTSEMPPKKTTELLLKEVPKPDEKKRLTFDVGERCLARWRDNKRFIATIHSDLGDGQFEIIFDDGFHWKCSISRLSKLRDSSKNEGLCVDTSMSPSTSALSPVQSGTGPMSNPLPAYHTHLFDPTRDYLGSKSERRAMKRKLNIKEIFNIGQKKKKVKTDEKKKKPKDVKKVEKTEFKPVQVKKEVPDAVASIIGTIDIKDIKTEKTDDESQDGKIIPDELFDTKDNIKSDVSDSSDPNNSTDPVTKEDVVLEKFEKPDESREEVIDKMKEVINKLEVDLINEQVEKCESPAPDMNLEVIQVDPNAIDMDLEDTQSQPKHDDLKVESDVKLETCASKTEEVKSEDKPKKLSKVKKTKKLRILQEKRVKKQVEKVKNELEEMKRQVEEMRKQMLIKTQELAAQQQTQASGQHTPQEMPESFLLPGEWCCRWVNNEPVGEVYETEAEQKYDANNKPALPRRMVLVEDKRLPEGWRKIMVRRSLGQSAGKWDVVLMSPDSKRFHTKHEMRSYLDQTNGELKSYESALLDFGIHLKLSRRMGWVSYTGTKTAPVAATNSTLPFIKKKKKIIKNDNLKKKLKIRKPNYILQKKGMDTPSTSAVTEEKTDEDEAQNLPIEDGYVYVGSLKVQVIDNLLRCPAEGCFKNFRNNTLIKMHIKHYHRDLIKMLGKTPKVLDLAYARTRPTSEENVKKTKESKVIKVKLPRPPKSHPVPESKTQEPLPELRVNLTPLPMPEEPTIDSPNVPEALVPKPVKRPKVLLPVRRPDPESVSEVEEDETKFEPFDEQSTMDVGECVDFEAAISTHTVTKPVDYKKKRKVPRPYSEDDEFLTMNSDFETRSSFPGSGTPDSKTMDKMTTPNPAASSESNEEVKGEMYMFTENGERVKIERMRREEIINCHCGFREEDGLMVQCELCLCWQHALCHNIQKESEVPEKYTCSICLNPRRGRRSRRFLHDQDRLYEGLLPGAAPSEPARRSHELSANLIRIQDALHALRVKYYVATKKGHPKLYLWAKDWENAELNYTQERLNSDYSDLNIIINNIGKENLPVKPPDAEDREALLLSGTLDFPITTTELERMARSMEQESRVRAPQPEAAIENSACRERLLRHVQRCQALIDARLDSIEAQVAELESQDPSFEDDETADYFPRTKQTIQMLMRDLETMEELGVIT